MVFKKGSLSEAILLALEKAVDGYVRLEDFTYNSHLYAYCGRWGRSLPKSVLSQAIKRLREKKLVEQDVDEDKIIFKLSKLGKGILQVHNFKEEDWDGRLRIVIFDIPENKRTVRNLFRRRLVQWGFTRWQQSVWLTKMDVTDQLRKLITNLEIDKWVSVIESDDFLVDNTVLNGRSI